MPSNGEPLTRARLAPAPHAMVRFPNGRLLPAEGEEVDLYGWWMRRLIDGDVVIVTDDPAPGATSDLSAPAPVKSRRTRGQRKEKA